MSTDCLLAGSKRKKKHTVNRYSKEMKAFSKFQLKLIVQTSPFEVLFGSHDNSALGGCVSILSN